MSRHIIFLHRKNILHSALPVIKERILHWSALLLNEYHTPGCLYILTTHPHTWVLIIYLHVYSLI